jgi:hypothetical protein
MRVYIVVVVVFGLLFCSVGDNWRRRRRAKKWLWLGKWLINWGARFLNECHHHPRQPKTGCCCQLIRLASSLLRSSKEEEIPKSNRQTNKNENHSVKENDPAAAAASCVCVWVMNELQMDE